MGLLHPLAWWGWGIFLACASVRAHDSTISLTLVAAVAIVVYLRRGNSLWSSTFTWAVRFAGFAVAIRLFFGLLIGIPMPGKILFTLPEIHLPSWLVGIRVGGEVTQQRLSSTVFEAITLASLILFFAAASSLASPHRLIRSLPSAFYELTVFATITASVLPQLVSAIYRIRLAKRLRGQRSHGLKSWRSIALPLLESCLERAMDLAASMESRGYGYSKKTSRYRPEKWKLPELLILALVIYLAISITFLNNALPRPMLLIVVASCALAPLLLVRERQISR